MKIPTIHQNRTEDESNDLDFGCRVSEYLTTLGDHTASELDKPGTNMQLEDINLDLCTSKRLADDSKALNW